MQTESYVQRFVPKTDSPENIYELFRSLGYPADKVLNPTKHLSDKYLRFLLILTKALDDIVFDIPDLTEDVRTEVYWSVCELFKNRLEKARSM
jgi:hypothetical protein